MDETSLETSKYEAQVDFYPTPSRWLTDPHFEENSTTSMSLFSLPQDSPIVQVLESP